MSENQEKILYISTCGEENLDKASFPWVLASAALAMDVEATIVLQSNAVVLAKQGAADALPPAGGLPPLKKLIADFVELGGKIRVCGPCIKERGIEESDLIAGAQVTAAAQVNIAAMESDAVFTY
jgi:uncharacterized protein involved in oxidation of intracellular sulfur